MIFTDLSNAADPGGLHNHLSLNGFRRSQSIAYKPNCKSCAACVPLRISVENFALSKSQKRISRRNRDLTMREMPAVAIMEHYELFRIYVSSRHGESGMADMSFEEYMAMVQDSPVGSRLFEFRRPDGSLHGVCLTDLMQDGYSLVYSFLMSPTITAAPASTSSCGISIRPRPVACRTSISAIGSRKARRWPTKPVSPARKYSTPTAGAAWTG